VVGIDVLPTVGANVYDIVRHDLLVVTTAGIEGLKQRLAPEAGDEADAAGPDAVPAGEPDAAPSSGAEIAP
jgi:hypothetical protein